MKTRWWGTAFISLLAMNCDAVDPEESGGQGDGVSGKADELGDTEGSACGNGVLEDGEECDGTPCCTSECTFAQTDVPVVEPAVAMGPSGTYPRATLLSDGRLLGVYERGEGGNQVLRSAISEDGGNTWVELGTVAAAPSIPGRTLANPHVAELPDGTFLAAYRHHDPGANGNTNFRLLVSASTDGGLSWQFRGEIEVYGAPRYGIWEPFLFVTPQGRLQAYYAKEREGFLRDIVVRDSVDGGASWGARRVVASAAGSREGMPGVTALDDGSLVAIFDTFRQPGSNNRFVVRTVQSNDDGMTWHNRRLVFAPANGGRNAGAPQISTLADGRLVASFMTDEPATTNDWPGNAATYLMVSENVPTFGNIRWSPEPVVVASASSFWPGLVQGPLHDPVVTFAKDGVKSAAVCLPDADVDENDTDSDPGDTCDTPTELDVLFIGNSFTQGENLPGLVEMLGEQAGIDIRTDRVTQGGRTLAMQVADPAVGTAINGQFWDYVVIQGNSTEPLTNLQGFLNNGQTLASWAQMAGSETLLYQTWARSAANTGYATNPAWGGSPTAMQGLIRDAYNQLSALTGATVAPVGDAWEATWAVAPNINLYAGDEYHQNIKGAYLNACVFFAALTDLSPVGNVGQPPAGVSASEALVLQEQAELVVQPSCR